VVTAASSGTQMTNQVLADARAKYQQATGVVIDPNDVYTWGAITG